MRYRWDLLPRFAAHVEHAQRAEARRVLDELFEIFRAASADLTVRKMRCAQTMSACIRAARLGGGSSEVIYDEHMKFLERLGRVQSWAGVKSQVQGHCGRLIDLVEPTRRGRSQRLVAGIMKDLRRSLADPRSLEQYAQELDLSVGHLSRTFATIVGRPFRDELRRLRMEAAMNLLRDDDLKIDEIARRVGLASASQFVADFRRYCGITPGKWRRISPRERRRLVEAHR